MTITVYIGDPLLTGETATRQVEDAFYGADFPLRLKITKTIIDPLSFPEIEGFYINHGIGENVIVVFPTMDSLIRAATSIENIADKKDLLSILIISDDVIAIPALPYKPINSETDINDLNISFTTQFDYISSQINNATSGLPQTRAELITEQATRATNDTAIVSSITALSAQINNSVTGLAKTRADLITEQDARATNDSAVASSVTALSAQVNNVTTGLPKTRAELATEQTTRADNDTAIASNVTALSAQINNATTGLPKTRADLVTEQGARAFGDSAVADTVTTLSAQVNNSVTGLPKTRADVITEQNARVAGDSAVADTVTALQAKVSDDISAAILAEQSARSNGDGAVALSVTTLSAQVNHATSGLPKTRADLVTEQKTRADNDTTIASSVTALSTTVGSHTTSISSQLTSINGLNASYSVKIDANGFISGYGLASDTTNGVTVSSFAIRADRFSISSPTNPKTPSNPSGIPSVSPFEVRTAATTIDGVTFQPGVYLDNAYITKLTVNQIDARGLVIKDENGNLIIGLGTGFGKNGVGMDYGYIGGSTAPAPNATKNINYKQGGTVPTGQNGDTWFVSTPTAGYITGALYLYSNGWQISSDSTRSQLAGSGVNVMHPRYCTFEEAGLPTLGYGAGGPTPWSQDSTQSVFGSKSLKIHHVTTANDYVTLAPDFSIKLQAGKKWIFSCSVRCSAPSIALNIFLRSVTTNQPGGTQDNSLASLIVTSSVVNSWARYSGVLDLTNDPSVNFQCILDCATDATPYDMWFDGIMLEAQVGDKTTPSPYNEPPNFMATFIGALDSTKNTIYRQTTAPTGGVYSLGDLWFNTTPITASSPATFSQWDGSTWAIVSNVVTNTSQVTDGAGLGTKAVWANVTDSDGTKPANNATNDATFVNTTYPADKLNLQGQIDGKIESWFQIADPASSWSTTAIKLTHTGDTWFKSDTKKLYRYNNTSWNELTDQKAIDAYDNAGTAQSTADGKAVVFIGTTNPTNYDIGDLWDSGATPRNLKTANTASPTYNAAHWTVSANLITDTNQILDSAGLGQSAAWASVVNRPTSLATLNTADGTLLTDSASKLNHSANLLYNGGFENGTDGWGNNFEAGVGNSIWGTTVTKTGLVAGTYVLQQENRLPVQAGAWYVITGDSLLLNPGSGDNVYFDLIFKDGNGADIANGGDSLQNPISYSHDFNIGNANRDAHAIATQAPSGAVSAMARFVAYISSANVIVGCRQIKVERRGLPATAYSSEATFVMLQSKANTAAADAIAANAAIGIISSDGWLSMSEKPDVISRVQSIDNEQAGIDNQADVLVIGRVNYDTAITNFHSYLVTLSPAWNDKTQDTPIDGTLLWHFENVAYYKQLLLNAFVTKNKSLADQANGAIAVIVNNGILDASEKPAVRKEWDQIILDYEAINSQAQTYGTDFTAYQGAINDLYRFLDNGSNVEVNVFTEPPSFITTANLSVDTPVVRQTMINVFADYYYYRTYTINLITDKAATMALWSGIPVGGGRPVDDATKNLGDYANLIGKVNPANRDAYLANNCTSYASSTKGVDHQVAVHGSTAVPTSILVTAGVYITTGGGSVNARARLSVYRLNAAANGWDIIYVGGVAVYDQATISMVSAGGAKVPFHITMTCTETTSYRFAITNDADIVSWAEHVITTLEVVK